MALVTRDPRYQELDYLNPMRRRGGSPHATFTGQEQPDYTGIFGDGSIDPGVTGGQSTGIGVAQQGVSAPSYWDTVGKNLPVSLGKKLTSEGFKMFSGDPKQGYAGRGFGQGANTLVSGLGGTGAGVLASLYTNRLFSQNANPLLKALGSGAVGYGAGALTGPVLNSLLNNLGIGKGTTNIVEALGKGAKGLGSASGLTNLGGMGLNVLSSYLLRDNPELANFAGLGTSLATEVISQALASSAAATAGGAAASFNPATLIPAVVYFLASTIYNQSKKISAKAEAGREQRAQEGTIMREMAPYLQKIMGGEMTQGLPVADQIIGQLHQAQLKSGLSDQGQQFSMFENLFGVDPVTGQSPMFEYLIESTPGGRTDRRITPGDKWEQMALKLSTSNPEYMRGTTRGTGDYWQNSRLNTGGWDVMEGLQGMINAQMNPWGNSWTDPAGIAMNKFLGQGYGAAKLPQSAARNLLDTIPLQQGWRIETGLPQQPRPEFNYQNLMDTVAGNQYYFDPNYNPESGTYASAPEWLTSEGGWDPWNYLKYDNAAREAVEARFREEFIPSLPNYESRYGSALEDWEKQKDELWTGYNQMSDSFKELFGLNRYDLGTYGMMGKNKPTEAGRGRDIYAEAVTPLEQQQRMADELKSAFTEAQLNTFNLHPNQSWLSPEDMAAMARWMEGQVNTQDEFGDYRRALQYRADEVLAAQAREQAQSQGSI